MTCRCKEYEACGFARCCDVTVTHDGPPVVTPARGMGVGGMETTFAREGHAFRAGIREGERRMLWALACGAHLASELEGCGDGLACVTGMAYGMVANDALRALAARGDEDASRVLGERGW